MNSNIKIRTQDEVKDLLDAISPLLETPYRAGGKTKLDGSVTATFSELPEGIDLGLFFGFVTHAPLMVRELLIQLDALMNEIRVP